jgi:hypothetical protein
MFKPLLTALGVAVALAPGAVRAEGSVRLPAFRPTIGQESTYRVYIEASVDAHGAVDGAGGVMKGEFSDRVAIVSASPQGYVMRWRLEPRQRAANALAPSMCDLYREKMEAFGFDGVMVETNRAGAIQKVEQTEDIRRNVESRIAEVKDPRDPAKERLQALLRDLADPLAPVAVIAPAARLLADAQLDHEQDFEIGVPQTKEDAAEINGVHVPFKIASLVTADMAKRTMTFTLTKTLDPAAYAYASRETIGQTLTHIQQKYPDASPEKLRQLATASMTVSSKATVSLDDGTTIFAEEIVDNRLGPLYLKNVLRATRE